jgi:hypothetical protein
MTYNFDPERWYDDQRMLLEMRRREGALDEVAFEEALQALERRYDAMLARLDGTYQLPLKKDVS